MIYKNGMKRMFHILSAYIPGDKGHRTSFQLIMSTCWGLSHPNHLQDLGELDFAAPSSICTTWCPPVRDRKVA